MSLLIYDLQINLNSHFTFFLNQGLISHYSLFLRKMIKQSKKTRNQNNTKILIEIDDFPGGPEAFELVSRFCYSNGGEISIDFSNVATLYCCSIFLEMTEKLCSSNLLFQTEKFLEGMFYWSWNDIVLCLKSSEQVFLHADSYGLIDKLVFGVLAKIAQNSDMSLVFHSPSPSSSVSASSPSPETVKNRSESGKRSGLRSVSCVTRNEWWFEDLSILGPEIIGKLIKNLGVYDKNNNSLILTRFLLHYFNKKLQIKSKSKELTERKLEYAGLADTAVEGVIFAAKTAFSCRKIFWVLRVLSGFGISKESRTGLEKVIGEMMDQVTVDDLLISSGGNKGKGFYDVDLVIRLLKVFVSNWDLEEEESRKDEKLRIKRIGKLIDEYLREICPDQNLKVSKFLEVAESLPDLARDCFNGVYRAIDIYLESHKNLSTEERTKLCRCLNYKKLTLETCKQLAKNPKIPPNIAIQALKSQQLSDKIIRVSHKNNNIEDKPVLVNLKVFEDDLKKQWKVMDTHKICNKAKKSEVVSRLVRDGDSHSSTSIFPRLC